MRVDSDEKMAVADLRAKGMTVVDQVDKTRFQSTLAPVYADFEKQFGKANLDRIRNYK
jgi:TRAP-type transport system periplasmic protein